MWERGLGDRKTITAQHITIGIYPLMDGCDEAPVNGWMKVGL
jgi:hypothetical protein